MVFQRGPLDPNVCREAQAASHTLSVRLRERGGEQAARLRSGATLLALSAAVKVRIDDPVLLPDLMADLSRRVDAVVTQTGDNEIEVSLLGSRAADADVAELRERVRAWGRRGATVSGE